MKESKAVNVTKRDLKENVLHKEYQLFSNNVISNISQKYKTNDVGVQYDYKKDNLICTCRNYSGLKRRHETRYFSSSPKQIYAYHRSRSYTEIGVGSIKALQKKKVKKIYVPDTDDRGVGSIEVTSFIYRKPKYSRGCSYFVQKKTSSKCIGGTLENVIQCMISAKLSPILHTKSGITSPHNPTKYREINTDTMEKHLVTTTTQMDTPINASATEKAQQPQIQIIKPSPKPPEVNQKGEKKGKQIKEDKSFSSDSLVQCVHNLDDPSEYKPSPIDPMENKLEREYRKMFSSKSKEVKDSKVSSITEKPIPEKSTSLFRRRFTALRRSLKKKESANVVLMMKTSSQASVNSVRDVSITSDPPSLEGRSYSNTVPFPSDNPDLQKANFSKASYQKCYTGKNKQGISETWSKANAVDSEYASGVKGMFKLWGKKFDLEDSDPKKESPPSSFEKQVEIKDTEPAPELVEKAEPKDKEKKDKKKFFFFKKKKSKDKTKEPNYKQKKGVTTGRCEVRDGLTIKIGAAHVAPALPSPPEPKINLDPISGSYEEMLKTAWLMRFLTSPIESRNSVKIRWNNKTYTTSSSTVFELMENMYKGTGVVLTSKSEVFTNDSSSFYSSYTRHNVNFIQNIEAWMIPDTIPDQQLPLIFSNDTKEVLERNNNNKEVTISDQKWLTDKSETFARKVEVVLHSNNVVKLDNLNSSLKYLRIDIPKGFFFDDSETSSSDEPQQITHTSEEEVYKIVEYDTLKSNITIVESKTEFRDLQSSDNDSNDINVTIKDSDFNKPKILETMIKRPPKHRDVVTQGSNVYIPKKCDVISVGIITQRDVREARKPFLRILEYLSDEDSTHSIQERKKCDFAESYLQEYYKHWQPSALDLFSWCVSDSHLKCCSEDSHPSLNNGDGSKSCPNIYDDYLATTTSCCSTSCSETQVQSCAVEEKKKQPKQKKGEISNYYRILPKDSVEVFKRRKVYAVEKSRWLQDIGQPYSTPSNEDCGVQNITSKKSTPKRVILPDCNAINEIKQQLSEEKCIPGILVFGGCKKEQQGKSLRLNTDACEIEVKVPPCKIPEPPSKPCKPEPLCRKPSPPSKTPSPSSSPCKKPSPPSKILSPPCCIDRVPSSCDDTKNSSGASLKVIPKSVSNNCPTKGKAKCKNNCDTPPCKTPSQEFPWPPKTPCSNAASMVSSTHSVYRVAMTYSAQSCGCASKCKSTPDCNSKANLPTCRTKEGPAYSKLPGCDPDVLSRSTCGTENMPKGCSHFQKPDSAYKCCIMPGGTSPNRTKHSGPIHNSPPNRSPPMCHSLPNRLSPLNCPSPPKKKLNESTFSPCLQRTSSCECSPSKIKISKCPPPPPPTRIGGERCDFVTPPKPPCPEPKIEICPPPVGQTSRVDCPKTCPTKSLISGIHLRKYPSLKKEHSNCSDDLIDQTCQHNDILRLNSKEEMKHIYKEATPSTQEIRGNSIKIYDDDGKTIVERKDYTRHPNFVTNSSLSNRAVPFTDNLYKDSKVNRVATPITVNEMASVGKGNEIIKSKSDISIANVIEINFKFRVTQGDKTTEINIGNEDNPKAKTNKNLEKEVFVVKNEHSVEEISHKNDLNIRILIKNYKTKPDTNKHNTVNAFSEQISKKFNTVSTVYSTDFKEKNPDLSPDTVFSIHRATIDLTASAEKSKIILVSTDVEDEKSKTPPIISQELEDKVSIKNKPEPIVQRSGTLEICDIEKSLSEKLDVKSPRKVVERLYKCDGVISTDDEQNNSLYAKTSDEPELANKTSDGKTDLGNKTSDERTYTDCGKTNGTDSKTSEILVVQKIPSDDLRLDLKKLKKEEKKGMLKQVFENANYLKKPKTRTRMQKLKNMLKSILTSDSEPEEFIQENEKEVSEGLAYTYDNIRNSLVVSQTCSNIKPMYPSVDNDSEKETDLSDDETKYIAKGCICSTFAQRLTGGCCCRKIEYNDQEISCDLINDNDIELIDDDDDSMELADAITQNSKHKSSLHCAAVTFNGDPTSMADEINKPDSETIKAIDLDSKESIETVLPQTSRVQETRIITKSIPRTSDEDKVAILESKSSRMTEKTNRKTKYFKEADVLQLYETKKAVLEIYAERTVTEEGEHMVAKLPKFVYDKENEICKKFSNLDQLSFSSTYERNFVMMNIGR